MPDLVLVLCVYLGLHEHSIAGALGAFLLGYFLDSFSGDVARAARVRDEPDLRAASI